MRRSGWTPSAPNGNDQNVYVVVECDGNGRRCVWREAGVAETDIETVITDLLDGQYLDPAGAICNSPTRRLASESSLSSTNSASGS